MNKIVKLIYILVTVQFVIAMPKSVEKEQCDQLINDDSEASGLNLLYDSASSSEVQIIQNKKLKECLDFYMKNFFFLNERNIASSRKALSLLICQLFISF